MTVVTKDITFQSKGNCDIIDITSQVATVYIWFNGRGDDY